MPITWNAEANAKLFLAVLEQLKDQNVKLDYNQLAQYMGPECSKRSAESQIVKLKKLAAGDQLAGQDAPVPNAAPLIHASPVIPEVPMFPEPVALAGPVAPGPSTTPEGSPNKRRARGGTKSATPSKKKATGKGVKAKGGDEVARRLFKDSEGDSAGLA
ncbi:hypothetical protein BJX76DRAFT_357645 [Aspergillus varians]